MIEEIDLYWRPGCGFCTMLNRKLEKLGVPMRKHNIWEAPADAAYVRSVANGTETVPTVAVGDTALVNPSANQVMALLAQEAPHLVPEGYEPPEPTALGRLVNRILGP